MASPGNQLHEARAAHGLASTLADVSETSMVKSSTSTELLRGRLHVVDSPLFAMLFDQEYSFVCIGDALRNGSIDFAG